MNILENERTTYEDVWTWVPGYRRISPGEQYARTFHSIVNDAGATVLDAGCGEGRGLLALHKLGYVVAGLDVTDAGLSAEAAAFPFMRETIWNDLRAAKGLFHASPTHAFGAKPDYVYSCDVLEHLPAQFTMLAMRRFLDLAAKGVFCSIYFQQEAYGQWMGRDLHLTVQPFVWWRDSLRELGEVVEARDCDEFGLFYVRPR